MYFHYFPGYTCVWFLNASFLDRILDMDEFPTTVDSITASPAATTPALKSTFGLKPSVSLCMYVCMYVCMYACIEINLGADA